MIDLDKWKHETCKISDMRPYEKNPRKITKEGLKQLKASLENIGYVDDIALFKDGRIAGGHARYYVFKDEGVESVPVKRCDIDLTPEEEREVVVRLNKNIAGEWDFDILANDFEIEELLEQGFTQEELSIEVEEVEGNCDEDEVPEVKEDPITKRGDVWLLGEHRVMCGDSTMIDDVEKLMSGDKADMVFTDPPYGMNYSGRGKTTSKKIMNDNIDPTEFYNLGSNEYLERYIWGRVENYSHLRDKPRDVIIWKKNNFGTGKGYRGQYECCFYYGRFDGSDSDVWEVPKDTNYIHPTQKPTALCERAIMNSNPRSVIDYFLGSGSTLIACEKTNRKCYGMELDEHYCDVIINRYINFSGNENVVLEGDGRTYKEIKNERSKI